MSKSVYLFQLQGAVVVDKDASPMEVEKELEVQLNMAPSVYLVKVDHVDVTPMAEEAICCPVCGEEIGVTIVLDGTYTGVVGLADGIPQDVTFEGKRSPKYYCKSDESHDVSEVSEKLRILEEISS